MNTLRKEFEYVRNTFFPRWDRERKWRVRTVRNLHGARGFCDSRTKTVKVAFIPEGERLTLLLIHEIAHALHGGHAKKWLTRMEKVAMEAERLGRESLAALVREEIAGYRDAIRVPAGEVYGEIEDAVMYEPGAKYLDVVDFVRRDLGLSRPEFFAVYRRAKRVFEKAVRSRKQCDAMRERSRQRRMEQTQDRAMQQSEHSDE